jgi:para-nitrobenzyl esterase
MVSGGSRFDEGGDMRRQDNSRTIRSEYFGLKFLLGSLSILGLIGFGAGCSDDTGDVYRSVNAIEANAGECEQSGTTACVASGKLQGTLVGTTREFLGIPYATPPVGELRFAPPEPVEPWTGVRQATAIGPSCPQNTGAFAPPGTQSEDCLTLNVYTPQDAKRVKTRLKGLPVMVFIHGGAFVSGGSILYDSQKLSEVGHLVVVTINYRLGALGFLSHPDLDQTRPFDQPSGNDAIRDQQMALRWVQGNIGAFGGNASNVTVFGESAGSMSTCLQMVSPLSRDLAQRFIMESAVCIGGLPVIDKASADAIGAAIGADLCPGEADVIACLRAKPTADLVAWRKDAGISGAGWGPVYNAADPVLPAKPITLVRMGIYNKGPIILGSNKNEWRLFQAIGLDRPVSTIAEFNAALDKTFGEAAGLVKSYYTVASDAEANTVYIRLMTDSVFRCPARQLARLTSVQGSIVHLYSFEEGVAMHASEIPYVFGNPSQLAPVLVEPLRAAVQGYFTQFAKIGDPNGKGQAYWPAYNLITDQHMTLKAESEVGSQLSQSDCDFWDLLVTLGELTGTSL